MYSRKTVNLAPILGVLVVVVIDVVVIVVVPLQRQNWRRRTFLGINVFGMKGRECDLVSNVRQTRNNVFDLSREFFKGRGRRRQKKRHDQVLSLLWLLRLRPILREWRVRHHGNVGKDVFVRGIDGACLRLGKRSREKDVWVVFGNPFLG
jgi:hypothetical protein